MNNLKLPKNPFGCLGLLSSGLTLKNNCPILSKYSV